MLPNNYSEFSQDGFILELFKFYEIHSKSALPRRFKVIKCEECQPRLTLLVVFNMWLSSQIGALRNINLLFGHCHLFMIEYSNAFKSRVFTTPNFALYNVEKQKERIGTFYSKLSRLLMKMAVKGNYQIKKVSLVGLDRIFFCESTCSIETIADETI